MFLLSNLANSSIVRLILVGIFVSSFITGLVLSIIGGKTQECKQTYCISKPNNHTNITFYCHNSNETFYHIYNNCTGEPCCLQYPTRDFITNEHLLITGVSIIIFSFIIFFICLSLTRFIQDEEINRDGYIYTSPQN